MANPSTPDSDSSSTSAAAAPRRGGPALDAPELLPYLPMLYVAWADGDLTAEEMEGIGPQLEPESQATVGPWLDPDTPPDARELSAMLRQIRRASDGLDRDQKLDLTGVGLALAQADGRVSRVERSALEKLERALGIHGTEAARQLLSTRRPARRQPEPEASFDVEALQELLAGHWHEVRRRTFELLSEPGMERVHDLPIAEQRARVLAMCQRAADAGLGALSFPEYAGGRDDMGGFITFFETVCCFDLSLAVKAGVQFGLFGGSVLNLGTERHHREYLPAIGSMELPGCFAMTETSHGSNVADLETTARFDPETDSFVLQTPHSGARKDYIGNAALHGRMATVFAQLVVGQGADQEGHGVHAFLVPIRDDQGQPMPGVRIDDCGPKMGLDGVDNGRLYFEAVRVPRQNLLDRFASVSADGVYTSPIASPSRRFFTMLGTLVGGRVSVALGALSATKTALVIAVRYAVQRRQFGPEEVPETRLLDYPTHQRRLMPRLASTYAYHFALDRLRRDYVDSDPTDRRAIDSSAAGLKAMVTWHATDTIQTCRECCGGQGYLAVNRFADLKADSDVFTTFEGDNTVLLQLLAKSLLGGYQRQFGRMRPLGLVRYVAERAATRVAELNPVVTRLTKKDHLLDREFHLAAFAWRAQHLLGTVARRLKKRLDRGMEMPDALLECQNHLVATARAQVEHTALVSFDQAVRQAAAASESGAENGEPEDAGLGPILGRVCDLFALSRLEADRGFFLETGYFEPAKSRAVARLSEQLSAELRPQAVHLVESFGIPDSLIDAPIAR